MKHTIDATGLILGRLATRVAKLALAGEQVQIINCEKAVISGKKRVTAKRIAHFRGMGSPLTGPFYPSKPESIVKRAIRGMLPHKQERGRAALKRIRCYASQPSEINLEKIETFPEASKEKIKSTKVFTIKKFSK